MFYVCYVWILVWGLVLWHNVSFHMQHWDAVLALVPVGAANVPGQAVEDGASAWSPAPTWETQVKLLVLGLPSPPLVIKAIWGVNQQVQDLFLSDSLPCLCISGFQLIN